MLPEFANGGAFPATAWFWPAFERRNQQGKILANIGQNSSSGAVKIKAPRQLVRKEGDVQRVAVGQALGQIGVSLFRPLGLVIAAGGLRGECVLVVEPLMTQAINLGLAEVQALRGGQSVHLPRVESGQNFLDVDRRDTMSELLLFILWRIQESQMPPSLESFSH